MFVDIMFGLFLHSFFNAFSCLVCYPEDHAEAVHKSVVEHDSVYKKIAEIVDVVKPKAKAKKGASSSSGSGGPPAQRDLPLDFTNAAAWQSVMPPGFKMYTDMSNQRHQSFNKHAGTCSRSWKLYGGKVSAAMVTKSAWDKAIELGYATDNPYKDALKLILE